METKKIIESLRLCAEKLGCLRYIVGNCEENISFGKVLDEAAERLEELEEISENWCNLNDENMELLRKYREDITELKQQLSQQQSEWISVEDEPPKEPGRILINRKNSTRVNTYSYKGNEKELKNFAYWMPMPIAPEPPKPKEPTFKDVFLEKFPKAATNNLGTPIPCLEDIFTNVKSLVCKCSPTDCDDCWNQPYFEEEEKE